MALLAASTPANVLSYYFAYKDTAVVAVNPRRPRDSTSHLASSSFQWVWTSDTPCPAALTSRHLQFVVVLGVLLATVAYNAVYNDLQSGLADQFVLSSSSAQDFGPWSSSSDPNAAVIYTTFYVYNITNPNEVIYNNAKPIVQEIGPLSYYYLQEKTNITWDPETDGDTLTYNQWQYYAAVDETTTFLETQVINTINAPLVGVLHAASSAGLGGLLMDFITAAKEDPQASLIVSRTAYETIWGWEDPLLAQLHQLAPEVPTYYPGLITNDTSLGASLAKHGPVRMYTGKYTKNLARQYLEWDGLEQMECCAFGPCGDTGSGYSPPLSPPLAPILPWNTEEAEQIRGGFGDQFHQFISPDETLEVSTHGFGLYRHWPLTSSESAAYEVDGITLYKFTWADGVLGNASVNEYEASAYNINGPSGFLNQSQCDWGAPIFLSLPRFYGVSDDIAAGVIGLPLATADDCETYLGVEPYTGATMDFHWRVGINIYLEPTVYAGIDTVFFRNVTPAYVPMGYADRSGNVDPSQASTFKSHVYVARDVMLALRWGGTALAGLAFFGALGCAYIAHKKRKAIDKAREVETAAYYADFYKPFLADNAHMPEVTLYAAQPAVATSDGYTSVSKSING